MKTQSLRSMLLLVLALSLGGACVKEEAEPTQAQEEHDGGHEGELVLSERELQEFGIEISVAEPGRIATTVELPGEIRPNAERIAHIAPRFPGIVKSVEKAVGDRVNRGDRLASIESSESLSTYTVTSLLEGVVIGRHVSVGESVATDQDLFVVADLSTVWVDFQAFQKHLPLLKIGQQVHISAGHGLPETEALVSYIAPVVDEATRTAAVRAILENATGHWRPGLFVTGRVETESTDVPVAVPKEAIQTIGDVPVVFVKDDDGFAPRPVHVGRTDPHFVEITRGLEAGEAFVSAGGFTLKAEMQRGELGEGHGH